MSIAVKLPGEFVSLETLLESIADALHGSRHALPEKLADGDLNPAALAWWVAHENHRERIRSLLRLGTLRGRNATSKDRLTIYMPDAVFFINDLNDCPELQDGLFQFILDTDASNDARLALMPEAEAYKWRKAAPFDETRRTIVRNYSEHVGTTAETLRQFCDEVTSRLERWHAGRYEIAEAAQVLADKNRLDAKALCTDMEIAAHTGELVRRVNGLPIQGRPLPYRLSGHKTILQRDVNKWLEKLEADYRLEYPYPIKPQAPPVVSAGASEREAPALPNWKMLVQTEATALCLRLQSGGANPTKNSILIPMAQWCIDNNVVTDGNINPSANYLRTHVLGGRHWDVPPKRPAQVAQAEVAQVAHGRPVNRKVP